MHWLGQHVPNHDKHQFTKLCWLTARDISKGAKIISKLVFPFLRGALRQNKEPYQTEKNSEKV